MSIKNSDYTIGHRTRAVVQCLSKFCTPRRTSNLSSGLYKNLCICAEVFGGRALLLVHWNKFPFRLKFAVDFIASS